MSSILSPFTVLDTNEADNTGSPTSNNSDANDTTSRGDRRWAMSLFSITTVLLFADQNLMAPNLTAIAEEFGFDDDERDTKLGGHIALAFWILGAPAALGVGILADHRNRSTLFAWVVGIGEGACFLTFWTTTYWELYLCRAITGFSIGGALPLIYSILGDLFPSHERHKVNACVSMGSGLGISVGQGIAGFIGPTFGWRAPFLMVSIPALLSAAAVYLTVKDPQRGGMEQVVLERQQRMLTDNHHEATVTVNNNDTTDDDHHQTNNATTKELEMQDLNNKPTTRQRQQQPNIPSPLPLGLRRRSPSLERNFNATELLTDEKDTDNNNGSLLRCTTTTNNTSSTMSDIYQRHMEPVLSDLKLLCQTPTVILALLQGAPGCMPWGIVNTYLNDFLAEDRGMSVEFATFTVLWFGVGNFFGMAVGGAGGQYLYQVDKRYPALLAGSMAIFGCAPFWVLLNGVNNNSSSLFIALVALISGAAAAVTGPIIKATLQNVTLPTMRGQAFALFNTFDDFGRGLGPVFVALLITSVGGRTPAFNLGTLGWLLCGVFNLMVFFTAERDERQAQATLSANLASADNVLC